MTSHNHFEIKFSARPSQVVGEFLFKFGLF